MEISKFSEKLNKVDGEIYVIEETVTPVNGIYEDKLIHDNVNIKTVNVYTGSKLTGDKINTYFTSTPSLTPWKTVIKIFSTISPLYISYETTGDTVEAEDVNKLQEAVVDTQKNLNSEIDRAKGAEKVLTDNLNSEITRAKVAEETLADNLDSEITRAKDAEKTISDNLDSETLRAKKAEDILTTNLSDEIKRAKELEDSIKKDINDNRANWNDAYNKRHIHNNKEVLDNLAENTGGSLTFKGSKIVSTTVNGLADDVIIEGGNNITISKDGNKLIVSGAGSQQKIVTNTPVSISSTDWVLDTTVTPNIYNAIIKHNLNDSNIIVSIYNGTQVSELVGIKISDSNTIVLSNYEAIDCRIVINSSGKPTEIIDNLDSSESTKALSAKQGKILKELISGVEGGIVIGDTLANAQPISLFLKIIG